MKRTYILTILAFTIVTYGILNQQTLQARSETAKEMEEGTASGEEAAGPVGAVVGGLFGGAVGLVKDTENVVTGETEEDRIIDNRYEDETMPAPYYEEELVPMTYDTYMDEGMDDWYTDGRSETAREMEKASASGEEIAGPLGAIAGGIVGGTVGLAKDPGNVVIGRTVEETEILEPRDAEIFMTDESLDDGDMDITMTSPVNMSEKQLTISEVE